MIIRNVIMEDIVDMISQGPHLTNRINWMMAKLIFQSIRMMSMLIPSRRSMKNSNTKSTIKISAKRTRSGKTSGSNLRSPQCISSMPSFTRGKKKSEVHDKNHKVLAAEEISMLVLDSHLA
jgi:hypothetical protein